MTDPTGLWLSNDFRCFTNRVGAGLPAIASVSPVPLMRAHLSASAKGKRAICEAFNDPKYNHGPYSRAVVIGE